MADIEPFVGVDWGYSNSRTICYSVWIDDGYEQMRHAMQDGSWVKFRVMHDRLLDDESQPESEAFLRIGVNWPGIVITDAPSPGLVSKGD